MVLGGDVVMGLVGVFSGWSVYWFLVLVLEGWVGGLVELGKVGGCVFGGEVMVLWICRNLRACGLGQWLS